MGVEDHATPSAAPPPPYRVVDRPAPGLARIADRHARTPRRWVRVPVAARRFGAPRRCANCGTPLTASYYRPPALPIIRDRLCVSCVEGEQV